MTIKKEPWFKPYAVCDWCGRATHDERWFGKHCSNEGGFMQEACRGIFRMNPIFERKRECSGNCGEDYADPDCAIHGIEVNVEKKQAFEISKGLNTQNKPPAISIEQVGSSYVVLRNGEPVAFRPDEESAKKAAAMLCDRTTKKKA